MKLKIQQETSILCSSIKEVNKKSKSTVKWKDHVDSISFIYDVKFQISSFPLMLVGFIIQSVLIRFNWKPRTASQCGEW